MDKVQRALQAWQVLISAAHNRQILTYAMIADLIGVGQRGRGAIAVKLYLGVIMRYCEKNHLPPITALIVNKGTGKPGSGLRTLGKHPDRDRERVFQYDWFKCPPLCVDDLTQFEKADS